MTTYMRASAPLQRLKKNKDAKGKTPHDLYKEHCYSLPLMWDVACGIIRFS